MHDINFQMLFLGDFCGDKSSHQYCLSSPGLTTIARFDASGENQKLINYVERLAPSSAGAKKNEAKHKTKHGYVPSLCLRRAKIG
jgi:hypothetical protein